MSDQAENARYVHFWRNNVRNNIIRPAFKCVLSSAHVQHKIKMAFNFVGLGRHLQKSVLFLYLQYLDKVKYILS